VIHKIGIVFVTELIEKCFCKLFSARQYRIVDLLTDNVVAKSALDVSIKSVIASIRFGENLHHNLSALCISAMHQALLNHVACELVL
jgi:hypothetical protein